jgi:hypothetical protein
MYFILVIGEAEIACDNQYKIMRQTPGNMLWAISNNQYEISQEGGGR